MSWIFTVIFIVATICAALIFYRKFPLHLIYRSKIGLQDMFDAIGDPLAVISEDYVVKRVNRAYISLIGKSFNETIDEKCFILLRGRTSPCEDCLLKEAFSSNKSRLIESTPHPHRSGSISITFTPCNLTLENSGSFAIEHIRDITLLENLKLDLEKRNISLANAMKDLKKAQQKIKDELHLARLIQRGILPKEAPELDKIKIAHIYHPVTFVGGDVYDFIKFSPTRLGIFIGDASGHGLSAAFISTISKMSLYYHTKNELPARKLLTLMNRDLIDNVHTGHYLTCVWCIFDTESNTLTFSRAGHPHPVLIRRSGEVIQLKASGTFVGLIDNAEYDEKSLKFEKSDRIYFFTDGIFETAVDHTNEKILGYDNFINLLKGCNGLPFSKVIPTIQNKLSMFTYEDDYTLIAIEIT
jgi:sigma-B regulation protein RsbU (phosphoserine phosphatase)